MPNVERLDASHVITAPEQQQQQQEGKEVSFFFFFCERSDVVAGRNFRLVLGFVQLTV